MREATASIPKVASLGEGSAPFSMRTILLPLVAMILGTFAAILDLTVVNVALPTLQRVFNVDLQLIQWTILGYSLSQAAVIPLAGWLSDRYGAKTMYLTALVMFTLGSLLCALASSAEMLIAFRVLQGFGGGMLFPIAMAFIYRLAPPDKRGAVMGSFGVPVLLAPALGPILSGYLVEYADWRYIFLLNIPVGIVALVMGLRTLPQMPAQRAAGALDWAGMVLASLGFAALSYGISQSTSAGWTGTATLAGLIIGLVSLVAFAAHELNTRYPLLELRVFHSNLFTRAILTQWLATAALFGTLFLVPLFLQQARGYGPLATGIGTLPQAVASAFLMPIGGRLFDRFGVRVPVLLGIVLVLVAFMLMMQISTATTRVDLILPLALWGAGMGLMIMPVNTYMLNAAPRELVSRVTSLSGAMQQVVVSLAVAGSVTILQTRTTAHIAEAGPGPVAFAAAFADTFGAAIVAIVLALPLALTLRKPASATQEAPARQLLSDNENLSSNRSRSWTSN